MTRPRRKPLGPPAPPVPPRAAVPAIPDQEVSQIIKQYDIEQPLPGWRHPFFVEEERSPLPALYDAEGYPVILFDAVPRARRRANGWCERTQRAFVAQLARTPNVTYAAEAVGKTPRSAYHLLLHPAAEQFAKAWDMAVQYGRHRLGFTALGQCLDGPEEVQVFRRGRLVRTERRFNDTLALALLAGRDRSAGFYLDAQARWRRAREFEKLDAHKAALAAAEAETEAEIQRAHEETRVYMERIEREAAERPRPEPRIRRL
ncbi:hypothetical protein [Sphingomonas mesophila]|uniref:hypothetical protein n=1 Tax=Sphingomonas mesophila TaxID=2303576 RepID=UPI000E57BB6A|nr:hypothetical protein [Sphingomonas mesophila]